MSVSLAERVCRDCKELKTDFARGLLCRECHRQRCRDYYYANRAALKPRKRKMPTEVQRARRKAAAYLRRYGITEQQRDEMLAAQGGVCAICKSPEPLGRDWCTDHDHECCPKSAHSCGDCIRGILCFRCNTLLGHARDDTDTLRSAIAYLDAWEETTCLTTR